jgi:23S rRNA C2498 (ribose-2'-O)-methylase RlmM
VTAAVAARDAAQGCCSSRRTGTWAAWSPAGSPFADDGSLLPDVREPELDDRGGPEGRYVLLGHAAGAAAAQAARRRVRVQDVDVDALQASLRDAGQVLS